MDIGECVVQYVAKDVTIKHDSPCPKLLPPLCYLIGEIATAHFPIHPTPSTTAWSPSLGDGGKSSTPKHPTNHKAGTAPTKKSATALSPRSVRITA